MRRITLASAFIALLVLPASAQSFEGNWSCRDETGGKAGILTIYGAVYGFASTALADAASGTGSITGYQDGVGFNDGGLKSARGIQAGRIVPDPTRGTVIQLETNDAVVMLCAPR
ncbi:hypothetical protein [Devosia sp. 1566]|uniref:hypothetical protein n=1 Tax=Devosia sp. 1566 TaxID=2499144 RepID=UPI000FD8E0EC|nr:hypothetical protein [Devosia sp. 1566]